MDEKTLHAVVFQDGESEDWVAMCLELDVVSEGASEEHARAMLKEAIELRLEDMSQDEIDLLFQPIQGDPRLTTVNVRAAAILR
jgi:predicted RNase H-like HicB family nuclease